MGYVLTFLAGGLFGVVTMCIFIVSGNEIRKEEKRSGERHIE